MLTKEANGKKGGGGSNDRALKMLNIALAYEFLKSILSKS